MAGAAEGVWRDSTSIHPFAIDFMSGGTQFRAGGSAFIEWRVGHALSDFKPRDPITTSAPYEPVDLVEVCTTLRFPISRRVAQPLTLSFRVPYPRGFRGWVASGS